MKTTLFRITTSLGCIFCIALVIMCYLVVLGGAFDPGIDLLKGLNLQANISQYEGVSITQGTQKKIAFKLQGINNRKLVLPYKTYERAVELLKRNSDFTFAATLKQDERNPGTIISFSSGYNRYLELQSSGRRNEIRFHYSYVGPNSELMVHMESFPYRLADNKWHKIAVSISGSEIQLIIDCHPLYKRVMHSVPDRNFSASNMQLLVGQRNLNGHSLFKGEIQDVHLLPGPYGYLLQCEHMDSMCPTCGQFLQLQSFIMELQQNLSQLNLKLEDSIKKIERLETCDCRKSCHMNGSISREDGVVWDEGCETCQCMGGVVNCYKKPCPVINCKNPVLLEGQCCPICRKQCLHNSKLYDDGDEYESQCHYCKCIDGVVKCNPIECPKLECSIEKQLPIADECCPYCKDVDYCAQGHECDANAKCHNLKTNYTCKCNKGFQGNGSHCADIDECIERGGENGHHCNAHTECINTHGSFDCQCLPGFSRTDKWNCAEINECETGEHSCHENAICANTFGSYTCDCKKGYSGNGRDCVPICDPPCLNGGECVAPNTCECRGGYEGPSCEKDLDECKTNNHGCPSTSICVNKPGWYYCKCKPGYEMKDNSCVDINECEEGTHSCHSSATCVNTEGHFECKCVNMKSSYNTLKSRQTTNHECKLSCMFEGNEILDQEAVTPRNQPCSTCTCSKGVISCSEPTCDCSQWHRSNDRDLCCPQCDPKESCQHQELKHVTFKSGEQWIYQCQTCECLYGEFDCWKMECPPLFCENPLPPEPGDCCRRCPSDSCGFRNSTITNVIGKPCFFDKHLYSDDQTMQLPSKDCTTCTTTCKVPYCAQLQVSNSSCFPHRLPKSCALIMLTLTTLLMMYPDIFHFHKIYF